MYKQVRLGSDWLLDLYFTNKPGVFKAVKHKSNKPTKHQYLNGEPVKRYKNDEVIFVTQNELFKILTGGVSDEY